MNRPLLFSILYLLLLPCFAQKTELRLAVNSGLSTFAGPSAQNQTFINYDDASNAGYTNNPYGSGNKITYGVSANLQHVGKKNFIIGIDAGFERFGSNTAIKKIAGNLGGSTYQYIAHGATSLNYESINVNPNTGYRFTLKSVFLDVTGGLEIGSILSAREDGRAIDQNGKQYRTVRERKTINTDFRPRIQISACFGKAGINAGYAVGLSNYKSGFDGGTSLCFSRIFRVGLTYKLSR